MFCLGQALRTVTKVDLKEKPYNLSDSDINWVKETISSMSIEEKIGQLFVKSNI